MKKVGLLFGSLIFCSLLLEVFFRFIFIHTDNFGQTLSAKKWFSRYWNPINSLGYRDFEPSVERIGSRKILAVVGDSIAAGHGIRDIRNRFSGQLQEKIKNDWVIVTLAECGWNTPHEYTALKNFPYKPDAVILSYFPNDIGSAGWLHGFVSEWVQGPSHPVLVWSVNHSYFLNELYWRGFRYLKASKMGRFYWDYIQACFDKPLIWKTHQRELAKILSYANEMKVPLMIVMFPRLEDIDSSQPLLTKVGSFMAQNGAAVMNVSADLSQWKLSERIVNALDAHPSVKAHEEVARMIYDSGFLNQFRKGCQQVDRKGKYNR